MLSPSRSWREPPACVCVKSYWPIFPAYIVKPNSTARSTSRKAPKVAAAVQQHLAGSEWMIIFAKHSDISNRHLPTGVITCLRRTRATPIFNGKSSAPHGGILHNNDLKGFHELRAADACERYEQIANHLAPINGGRCSRLDPHLDREARSQISYELGHGRIDVVSAYIGGKA